MNMITSTEEVMFLRAFMLVCLSVCVITQKNNKGTMVAEW